MKKLTTVAMLASLAFSGAALAQDDPRQGAQNSDTSMPNSPLKPRGFPDAGEFNPTGRAPVYVVAQAPAPVAPAPAPAPAPVTAPPPPPPAAPPPPPPPPAPAPMPPRADRG